jgi:hypothetical protein
VTPTGVRDGDPDALAGLCDRRGPAVIAYCEVVAGPGAAAGAAAEAFGIFRADVVAAGDLGDVNPEALLISATRHAAARHARSDAPSPCAGVPALLAGRADRSITLADHDWLEGHLADCWTCRAPVARFEAADRAYRDPPPGALEPEATAMIVAALTAAAPIRGEKTQAMLGDGAAAAGQAASANGSAAQATPAGAEQDGDHVTYVDQPTAAYQIGDVDVEPDEPSPDDRAVVTHPEPKGPRPALLGALGLRRRRRPPRGSATATGAAGAETATGAATAGTAAPETAGTATPEAAGTATPEPAGTAGTATPDTTETAETATPETAGTATAATGTATTTAQSAAAPTSATGPPRSGRVASTTASARRGRLRPAVVLPIALVIIAIVVALLVAGVFGGGEPASVPESFAPRPSTPTNSAAPRVVVVPGAATASAAAVEREKARARAAKRRAAAAKSRLARRRAPTRRRSAATAPPAARAPARAPARNESAASAPAKQAPRRSTAPAGGARPKINADNGATGVEQLPPARDTSTVPELAPPVEPAVPPG